MIETQLSEIDQKRIRDILEVFEMWTFVCPSHTVWANEYVLDQVNEKSKLLNTERSYRLRAD